MTTIVDLNICKSTDAILGDMQREERTNMAGARVKAMLRLVRDGFEVVGEELVDDDLGTVLLIDAEGEQYNKLVAIF